MFPPCVAVSLYIYGILFGMGVSGRKWAGGKKHLPT
jgi:hypothetical protein